MDVELFQAAGSNDADRIRDMVTGGADPNQVSTEAGHTPLRNACAMNAVAAVRALLDLGANPNQRFTYRGIAPVRVESDRTALMYARSAEVAAALLEAGADPNAVDGNGHTPLTLAALRGAPEVVAALLAAGADPAARIHTSKEQPAATALELAEDKIAMWRDLLETNPAIADRIAKFEQVKSLLVAREGATNCSNHHDSSKC